MSDVKILLVEDESIEALDIKHTLESFGYEVPYVASTGKEAVDKALEIMPDLILMDVILKGNQDGIDAAYQIKNLNIPLIYLTAHSEESTIERAKLTEPYGYIIKPYDSNELKYAIELAIYKSTQEKKLKDSEERYRMLFENSQVSTAITAMDGKVLAANEKFFQMVGYLPEEVHQIDLRTMYRDVNQRNAIIEILKKKGKVRQYEVDLLRKDGSYYTNSINVDVISYQDEDAMLVTAIEITERKKAEMELIKSEKRYRDLYSTMGEGMAIHEIIYDNKGTSVDYKILDVNPSYEKILGIQKDDVLGKKASEIYEVGKAPYLDIYSSVVETGKPAQFETYFEPIDKYFHISIFSPSKGTFVTVFEDITERQKLESELKESEGRFRSLFNYMVDGVAVYSAIDEGKDFIFKDYNKAAERIDGVRKEDVIGKRVTDVFPGVKDFGLFKVFQRVYRTGKAEHHPVSKYEDDRVSTWRDNFIYKLPSGEIVAVYEDVTERVQAEEEVKNINRILQEREEQLRLFIEYAPASIAMFDTQMNYISASNRWITDYHLEGLELVGRSHYEVFPEITDELKEVHKRALEGATQSANEDKFVREDGTVQWLKWEVIPWYSASGSIGGIIIFSEDITDLKLANESLKQSEAKYRYVIETAEEGIVLFDKKGMIIEANPKASEFAGINEVLVGKNLVQLVPNIKINLKEALGAFKDILSNKPMSKAEWEFKNKIGETKFVKANYNVIKKDGKTDGIALVLEDITDLKLREKALKENEQFLENIIENIPDMIFVKDADDLKFERVNKAAEQIWGYDRDELIGNTDYDFFTKDEADFYTRNDREVLDKKEPRDILEETIHTRLMGERILHTKKIPLLDDKGRSNYLLGISEDITQRKKAEIELKNSLIEKEALLREIHHRVKNNMQIISSLLNLQIDQVKEEESKDVLKDSQSRVKSMAMIHEKLYMSRDLSHINFKEYTEKLVSDIFYTYEVQIGTIKPILKVENIEINMETAIPLGLIINELVTNSLKFAFPEKVEGSVTVELKIKDGEHTLSVADDGVGIPENIDFKKTESLGLQLVNSLVNQIDGVITLDRSNGTEFKILFKELDYTKRV
jgi:PAS domain S-box-containing protein